MGTALPAGEAPGAAARARVLVLGSCAVSGTDDVGGARLSRAQGRILARLALAQPEPVSVSDLEDAVWDAAPPPTARAALHNQISRIRVLLGDDAVATTASGYLLRTRTDAAELAEDVVRAERALALGEAGQAFSAADRALASWRGSPFEDLAHHVAAEASRRRLLELRSAGENVRLEAAMLLGHLAWALPEAERLVALEEFDEHRWLLLARVLHLAGRRGDALGALQRARRVLRDGLGISPGAALLDLERTLVQGDPGAGADDRAPARFVGRHRELQSLRDAAVGGRTVVVTGESGIGKSRLVGELARLLRREGVAVATARCGQNPDTPVSVLVDLLDELQVQADAALGPLRGFLPAVLDVARARHVVLVVDDAHLAGLSSRAALAETAGHPGIGLVAVVAEPAPAFLPGEADVLRLTGLSHPEHRALAELLLAGRPAPVEPDRLHRMSGGNPLFLECLLEDLPDTGSHPTAVGASAVLAGVVQRRLQALPGAARTAMELAAVCGTDVATPLLLRLVGQQALTAGVEAGLLVEQGGRTSFRHGALQQVVYASLSPGRRAEAHHAAGLAAVQLLASGVPAATAATHLLLAGDLDRPQAAELAQRAAQEATRHAAHRDAAAWYERSAETAEAMGPHAGRAVVEATIGWGDALRLTGDPRHEQVLCQAVELAMQVAPDLIGEAAFALLQLGATTESGVLHPRAAELAERALARVDDPDQRALVSAAASLTHTMTGHPERCRALFIEAEQAARSSQVRRRVLPFAYLALGLPEELDRRSELAEELLALSHGPQDPVAEFEAWHLVFSVSMQRGDGARLRASLERMRQLVDRVGDVGRRWSLLYSAAALAHLEDDLPRSEALAADALQLFWPVSESRALAVFSGQLLALRLAQHRVGELAGDLQHLVTAQPGVPAWHAALALSLVGVDDAGAREHVVAALLEVPRDFAWLAGNVIAGRAAARLGDQAEVEEYRRRLLPWSGLLCWQGTCCYGPVDTVLAVLAAATGDAAAARTHAGRARQLAGSLGAPVFTRELDELGL